MFEMIVIVEETGIVMVIAGIDVTILVLVLRVEVTEEDTVTGIEMTTDAEILVDLLKKEANTTLEDIDNDISSRSNPYSLDSLPLPILSAACSAFLVFLDQ